MAVCSSCSRELPGEFAFCPFCGAPVELRGEPAEERKVVTCLFCDLVGFTSRAELLDPEDVRAMLRPYHARVRAELERHGGTVEKFIGDAVMAVFGAPVAHEDDPERAVRAALAIRDSARDEGVELRIGIATGEALVTLDARPAEGEGMASGDVVNTAARLQSAAPVYGVLVGETTFRATRRAIAYAEVPPVAAKGKAEPAPAWEAVEARSRFGTEVLDHFSTDLVGRDRELDVLRSALDRMRNERSSQLVTLVGVPGIGKSRLLHELSRVVDAEPELTTWRQGRCLAYGDGVTFWALAEIVKAHAGILEGDAQDDVLQKLHAVVADAVADPQEASWIEARLRPLAGLETDAEIAGDRRGESFAAWKRFVEALANERPLIAVFEDLQWADDGLLDFIDELSDWASGVPLLLLCTARPELLSRRPSWGGGKLNATTVALSPLSETETASLIAHVLERSVLPAETQRALLERAEGNPLYAEQFALLYAERGSAEELPLPENLRAIVAARLDALPAAEKALLQDASVFGKVFWTGCLQQGPEPLLRELTRKGFVRRQLRSSVAGQDEYAFGHVLVRDVAYGQIPRAERSRKHASAARWIEALGRHEDHAEMRAHHWRAALELARAAGQPDDDVVEPSRRALREAGDRAASLNAHAAAESYYADALSLWPEDDGERADLRFRRARALHLAGDERRDAALAEARDALIAAGDPAQAAEASAFLARIAWLRGAKEESLRHLAAAEELAAAAPPSPAKARVLATSARQRVLAGGNQTGRRLAEEALAMARDLGLAEQEAHALTTIGTALMQTTGGGRDELEQALEIALAANIPEAATVLTDLAVSAGFAGDFRKEDELLAEAGRVAERFGDADSLRFSSGDRIWTRWALGHWDEAMALADQFIAECEHDPHYLETSARMTRAEVRAARGDTSGALEDTERALALARRIGDPQSLIPTLAWNGYLFATLGRTAEARALALEAIAFVDKVAVPLAVLAAVSAQLAIEDELREVGERASDAPLNGPFRAAAADDHALAADLFADMGAATFEAFHRFVSAEALLTSGRHYEGVAELERALAFYRSVGASAFVRRGDALLGAKAGLG